MHYMNCQINPRMWFILFGYAAQQECSTIHLPGGLKELKCARYGAGNGKHAVKSKWSRWLIKTSWNQTEYPVTRNVLFKKGMQRSFSLNSEKKKKLKLSITYFPDFFPTNFYYSPPPLQLKGIYSFYKKCVGYVHYLIFAP